MLYKHQQDVVDKLPTRHLLAHGTGTGKTVTAISCVNEIAKNRQHKNVSVLVICPKSLVTNWNREIAKYAIMPAEFLVMSKENFKKHLKTLYKPDILIFDEAHYAFGMTGFRNKSMILKSLLWFIKKYNPSYIYLLTATPYLSTPYNIYAASEILGHGWNYMEFKSRFFQDIPMGPRMISVARKGIEEEIGFLVKALGSTVKLEDCVDVPDQIFEREFFDLLPDQAKAIKELSDFLPIVRFTKQHQIENGVLKSDGYSKDEVYKNEKNERIIELCSQNTQIAIVCRYNLQIKELNTLLHQEFPHRFIGIINGKTPVEERQRIVDETKKNESCIILINSACSEGYSLETIPLMVFASNGFSLKDRMQMLGRIQRINAVKKNIYLDLIVKGGIDEEVIKSLDKKEDFNIEIYAKENI